MTIVAAYHKCFLMALFFEESI